jgi:prophage regulatory protein
MMSHRIIRINELATMPAKDGKPGKIGLIPVSRNTIWRWVREDRFPKPFKLGPATTVWDADQVDAFLLKQSRV